MSYFITFCVSTVLILLILASSYLMKLRLQGQFELRKIESDERTRLNSLLVSKDLGVASILQAQTDQPSIFNDREPGTFAADQALEDEIQARWLQKYGIGEDVGDFESNLAQDIKDLGLISGDN